MHKLTIRAGFLSLAASLAIVPAAQAQWAVIDVPAIAQLVQEVATMRQQLATARSQLESAHLSFQAMTGERGMERLLAGTPRNYLPANWTQVSNALSGHGAGGYSALSADVQSIAAANAVLSPQRMATLSPVYQQQIQSARQWNAMQEALTHEALANASSRFAAIQTLIGAISTAGDQKAILDLQARISAELGMLQNEASKLQVLYQATQAQDASVRQQARERVIDGQGRFEGRFQPTP
jgi:type IV secretion system protein VirB5